MRPVVAYRPSGPWQIGAPVALVASAALVATPVASLVYLLTSNLSWDRLTDFGVTCEPSTLLLTALYVLGTVTAQMVVGVWAAIITFFWAANSAHRLIFAIALLTIPYAVPSTIGFTMFEFLFAEGSSFQQVAAPYGSPLNGTWTRFYLMVLLGAWQFFPFIFVLTLAAFLAVPSATIWSARSDGATPFRIIRTFLLPAAMPVLVAAASLRTVLMLTKIDAPLAFHATSSNDYACLAAVRIYTSMGIGGSSVPVGLVLLLCGSVFCVLLLGNLAARRAAR